MNGLGYIVIAGYVLGLSFIFLYCLTQATLVWSYLRSMKHFKPAGNLSLTDDKTLPVVTIQLPIFNELYVVERLIDAVVLLKYPKDKLEIQVLDDSTDETLQLSEQKVQHYADAGYRISLVRRPDRKGFKAGALQYGLQFAKGAYIAIFDADFIPNPDFLQQTLPHLLANTQTGLVQTKWQHLNKEYSLLTKVQAFALDAHFNIEQSGRYAAGLFMHFNGTAGIWRKSCIEDAGGWSADTLTEDLDLSYRAQLKGWKFVFLGDVGSPAELPVAMGAIKSQQFRWNKGPAEVSRKLLMKVLLSDLPFKVKWHGFFHLLNSSVNIFVLLTAILSVPLLYFKAQWGSSGIFTAIYVFLLGFLGIAVFYLFAQVKEEGSFGKGLRSFLVLFPSFLSLSMGLSLHNALAAIRGLMGEQTAFIRTPKLNISNSDNWITKRYNSHQVNWASLLEVVMAAYFAIGIYIAIKHNEYGLFPFHLLLFIGFLAISYYSLKHSWQPTGKKPAA